MSELESGTGWYSRYKKIYRLNGFGVIGFRVLLLDDTKIVSYWLGAFWLSPVSWIFKLLERCFFGVLYLCV